MVAVDLHVDLDPVRSSRSRLLRRWWKHLRPVCCINRIPFLPRYWYWVCPCTSLAFQLLTSSSGEYPAGSVACAESTGELKKGHRNRWFIMFTNVQIDLGFVVSAFVPMVLVLIFSENHLRAVWRVALGLGVIPPLSLLWLRIKLKEPEEFNRETMKNTRTPWSLVFKFYWFRLSIVSLIWFIYDFSGYSFSIYSSSWLTIILGDTAPLWKTFGWNTVINLFYIPGAVGGAFLSDWIGPRLALGYGVAAQGIVGFIMTAAYSKLNTPKNVGGFVVIYGYVPPCCPTMPMSHTLTASSYPLESLDQATTSDSSHPRHLPPRFAVNTTP